MEGFYHLVCLAEHLLVLRVYVAAKLGLDLLDRLLSLLMQGGTIEIVEVFELQEVLLDVISLHLYVFIVVILHL